MKKVNLLYGRDGMTLNMPSGTDVLQGQTIPALSNCAGAVVDALNRPIGSAPLQALLAAKRPATVAITISDITRPVPNKVFMPHLLGVLNGSGIADSQIVIIIGTGMHRPSTLEERDILLGAEILQRIEVVDHMSDRPETLVRVCDDPPVSLCRRFNDADFKIVTGLIEPHFMAGFSGGRKGVCPALVDLKTIENFHSYKTLANPHAENGVLETNPCHEISLKIAKRVGVDFLFNVAITKGREMAGIYCGDLEKAHLAGCDEVARWTTAQVDKCYDLVVTNGGGYPLDQTFYQTTKGMCTALPALGEHSTLLIASHCGEQIGSREFKELMLKYNNNWTLFLDDLALQTDEIMLDQWAFQMQTRVLERIGLKNLWFVSDGINGQLQEKLSVHPISGTDSVQQRMQQAIDRFVADQPTAQIAIIPEGPYTLLKRKR